MWKSMAEKKLSLQAREQLLREDFFNTIRDILEEKYGEILQVSKTEICLPVVDSEGNEKYLVVGCKVPRKSLAGVEYDGYQAQDAYLEDIQIKEEEKRAKAAMKAREAEVKAQKRAKPTIADMVEGKTESVTVKVKGG